MKVSFVETEEAIAAKGLRIVVAAGIPSPWSEAAKGIFRVKEVPHVLVRMMPGDKTIKQWTRSRNVPVAMYESEPARTGWADILELAERLAPERSLVPSVPSERVRMFGLSHEVLGEGGLAWCGRLCTIAAGLESEGARGFPTFVAHYLAPRYGFVAERIPQARARVREALELLDDALGTKEYFFSQLSALDLYSAAVFNTLDPLPEELCPMMPPIRAAFESMKGEVGELPPRLLAHRQRMYERHLALPIEL